VTEPHDDFLDDIAASALGQADDEVQDRLARHLSGCDPCALRLMEYRAVLGALAVALEPVAPPANAWNEIAMQAHRSGSLKTSRIVRGLRLVKWPILSAIAAFLLVWNVALELRLAHYRTGPQVEALARRPGRMVILRGRGAPTATARLFVAADGGHGHLAIAGLRPVRPARAYQLWFIMAHGAPMSAATFDVDAQGRGWVSVALPPSFDDVRSVIVTEEPDSGSSSPGGQHLLDAQLLP